MIITTIMNFNNQLFAVIFKELLEFSELLDFQLKNSI